MFQNVLRVLCIQKFYEVLNNIGNKNKRNAHGYMHRHNKIYKTKKNKLWKSISQYPHENYIFTSYKTKAINVTEQLHYQILYIITGLIRICLTGT